jgi:hypothetical protein
MSYEDTLKAVRTGRFSEKQLRELGEAAYNRVRRLQEAARMAKFAEIPDGARVRVNHHCTDRTLVGREGEIVEHLYSNLRMRMDEDGRPGAGQLWKMHPSILDVVS